MQLYPSYLEMALLPCWRFLLDQPTDSLQRLVMMTRGLGDPVASAYCRLYMAHCAQKLPSHDIGILVYIVCQFLGCIKYVNQLDPFKICGNKICESRDFLSGLALAYIIECQNVLVRQTAIQDLIWHVIYSLCCQYTNALVLKILYFIPKLPIFIGHRECDPAAGRYIIL